jgi:hypothetical protein
LLLAEESVIEVVSEEEAGEVIEVVAAAGKVTAYSGLDAELAAESDAEFDRELDAVVTAVIAPSQSLLLPCDEFDAMIGDGA